MAEVKNAFIKSKMNKDLDDRLLPTGEYRDAVNVAVSKSESSDVGALENVMGNTELVDFENFTEVSGLVCVGYLRSEDINTIFVFLTDNLIEDNPLGEYKPTAENFIISYNVLDGTTATPASPVIRAQGAFLNFYEGNPIYGVNLLENLLFFTDNRNQPRRIDISKPSSYYTNEDHVSVAAYNPYQAIDVWQESTLSPGNYETTMKDVISEFYPGGGGILPPNQTTTGTQFTCNEADIQGTPQLGMQLEGTITNPLAANTTIISIAPPNPTPGPYTFTTNTSNTYSQGVQYKFNPNPYYNESFQGDPDYLTDIFARFSYRFQFEDNTYSLMAPYTQECFIPQQDGYFLDQKNLSGESINEDQEQAYRSTVVDFMQNKVNQIVLKVPLPVAGQNLLTDFKIKNLQILYKESDAQAIQVVDTIPGANVAASAGADSVFEYSYDSTKPFQTLPGNEIIRVYDKIPVKAFGQEVISNRIVYSNFQTQHSPPESIDYNVNVSEKSAFSIDDQTTPNQTPVQYTTSVIEYPNHSLKQNRNYQVGFVLSDRYGRSSTVILSNDGTDSASGLSTVYTPYRNPFPPQNDPVASEWPGDSLKVSVNNVIPVDPNMDDVNFYPGVYNGDISSEDYNPLGWYSYKIVVKQNEQDYYNVYLPGILDGYPGQATPSTDPPPPFPTNEEGYTANIVLLNDNINKVPRDLSEVGPEQRQFRSSVRLFGRVENKGLKQVQGGTPPQQPPDPGQANQQFYPGRQSDTVNNISTTADSNMIFEDLSEANTTTTGLQGGQTNLYQIDTQPLIGRLTVTQKIGEPTEQMTPQLAVYETEPTVSRLDIYYETTSCGLVQDLNYVVENNTSIASGLDNFNFFLTEGFFRSYEAISGGTEFTNQAGDTIPFNLYPGLQGLGDVVDRFSSNTGARFLKADFQGDATQLLGCTAVNANGNNPIVSAVDDGGGTNYWRITITGGTFPSPGTEIEFAGLSKCNSNGNFWPEDAAGVALEYSKIATDASNNPIFTATNNNNVDVTNHFKLYRVPKNTPMEDGSIGGNGYPYDTYYIATNDEYFLHDGFNPPNNVFKFVFQIQQTDASGQPIDPSGNPTTPSQFTLSNNSLSNLTPVIHNCPTTTTSFSFGDTQMIDFDGTNGSNINDPVLLQNGNFKYQDALTWSIVSVVGGQVQGSGNTGPFSIANYQDPATNKRYGRLTNDGTAIGFYTIEVKVSDSGGLTTTCTANYVFGETPLTGSFKTATIASYGLGSATNIYWTGNNVNLKNQMTQNDQDFEAQPNISNVTTPSVPSTPTGISATETCANCANSIVSCSSTQRRKSNEMLIVGNQPGIVTGTAYVSITMRATNSGTYCGSSTGGYGDEGEFGGNQGSTSTQLYLFNSFNIDYRANSQSAWTAAVDLNGDECGHAGGALTNESKGWWKQINSINNWQYGSLYSNGQPSAIAQGLNGNWLAQVQGQSSSTSTTFECRANRIFAFDTPGEYRLVTDNLSSNNSACDSSICSLVNYTPNTGGQDFQVNWGDFYYDFGSNRAFKYQIYYGSWQTVYAKEPLLRYVTQLYTDTALTNPKTGFPSTGTTVRLRTVNGPGTDYSAAGNYAGGGVLSKWPFEFSDWNLSNTPNSSQRTQHNLREWTCYVSQTGMVLPGSQSPKT